MLPGRGLAAADCLRRNSIPRHVEADFRREGPIARNIVLNCDLGWSLVRMDSVADFHNKFSRFRAMRLIVRALR
jgi:hypothetical protein